ncbi:hypothetical protein CI266_004659 [Salmonella enterica subsp. enterica serovar Kotte]|nr:hypothetical protein [Salmonella enterica subsp. enterica serovar Kotte]
MKTNEAPKYRIGQRIVLSSVHPSHDISKVYALGHIAMVKKVRKSASKWKYSVHFYASPGLGRDFEFDEKYLSKFGGQHLKDRDRHYFGKPNMQGSGWDFYPETTDQIDEFDQAYIDKILKDYKIQHLSCLFEQLMAVSDNLAHCETFFFSDSEKLVQLKLDRETVNAIKDRIELWRGENNEQGK